MRNENKIPFEGQEVSTSNDMHGQGLVRNLTKTWICQEKEQKLLQMR